MRARAQLLCISSVRETPARVGGEPPVDRVVAPQRMRVVVDAERKTPVVLAPPTWPSRGETREKRSEGSERGGDRKRLRADSNAPEDQGFPQLRLLALRVGIGLKPAGGRTSRR